MSSKANVRLVSPNAGGPTQFAIATSSPRSISAAWRHACVAATTRPCQIRAPKCPEGSSGSAPAGVLTSRHLSKSFKACSAMLLQPRRSHSTVAPHSLSPKGGSGREASRLDPYLGVGRLQPNGSLAVEAWESSSSAISWETTGERRSVSSRRTVSAWICPPAAFCKSWPRIRRAPWYKASSRQRSLVSRSRVLPEAPT